MMVTKRNIYHPFVNNSLGFFINSQKVAYSEELFTDLNLYWQPVQDPKISIPVLVIYILIFLAGSYVHYHLWKMLQREENLVSHVLKAYVIVQMIFWPFSFIFGSVTSNIYPLAEITGSWICIFGFFVIYPGLIFINFHTTIMAIMRYTFIVHDKKVASFGKQRTKDIFHRILGFVPIFMSIWVYFGAIDRDFDGWTAINKCNGSYDKIFLLLWGFEEPQDVWSARCGTKKIMEGPSSTIELIKFIQCKASATLFLLLLPNMFEGFIYYRTWTHIIKT